MPHCRILCGRDVSAWKFVFDNRLLRFLNRFLLLGEADV